MWLNMKSTKYIVTKHETIRRIEKVEYQVEIPSHIRNKEQYAHDKINDNDYMDCKVVDILDSEMLDDELIYLKKCKKKLFGTE